ncbi:Cystine-knot cytokine [Trinorchestia longiramus]|nr:Cystine-knot cytokine [Trinorchestia longiramus]
MNVWWCDAHNRVVISDAAGTMSARASVSCALLAALLLLQGFGVLSEQYPEGYYPFHEDPLKSPPRVRKPPYTQTEEICSGVLEAPEETSLSLDNLCGDLNTGFLPLNPLGQNVLGASYPFELIKNQTLDLFSKTLPVLKEDKTLPKVAKYVTSTVPLRKRFHAVRRPTRSLREEVGEATWSLVRSDDPFAGVQEPPEHDILATHSLSQNQDPHQHGILAAGPSKNFAREIFQSIKDDDGVNFRNVSLSGENSAHMKEKAVGGWSKTSNVAMSSGRASRRINSRDGRGLFTDNDSALWQGVLQGIFNGLKLDKKTASQIIENLEFDQHMAVGRGVSSFCQSNWGLFCLLYNTMMGRETSPANPVHATERRDKVEPSGNSLEEGSPLTPCPSAVEYVTPVFARNYQGVWRYVVQIPYEGYFTQTVEITQCLEESCHYLSGSCLASPRWVSLLVAEIFYPDAVFPSKPTRPSLQRTSPHMTKSPHATQPQPHQRLKREAKMRPPAPHYCDGVDQIGCFQVRLYYDWFLVPGSCKCWKRNVFQQNFRHRR